MKQLYDSLSFECSKKVTRKYSTSFSTAVGLLSPTIQPAIHSIYGFVRLADEIVDSFHETDQRRLLFKFELDLHQALEDGISLNPILNSFQQTVRAYNIDQELIIAFLKSMKMDLDKSSYTSRSEYEEYIYGSADVVGLMCLKVFVNGNEELYSRLRESAMHLGSAFQKVNFLRDLKTDTEVLNRSYFPNVDFHQLTAENLKAIADEIESDFKVALEGIVQLPQSSRFGVYTAYIYFRRLLFKLKKTPATEILNKRIRIQNHAKIGLLVQSYFNMKLGLAH
jgi:phytoene/squalene synthetase